MITKWSGGGFNFMSLVTANSSASVMLFRPWTVITYMFAHEGIWHLAMNLLVFFYASRIFTTFLSEKKLLPLYLAGGVGGFLIFFLIYNLFPAFESAAGIPILGASASVMAVLIGAATLQPNYPVRLILIGEVKLMYIALGYLVLDFLSLKGGANVGGHLSHFGGAIIGFLMIRGLQNGKDFFAPIEDFLGKLGGLFKKGAKFKVVYKNDQAKSKKASNVQWDQSSKSEKQKKTDIILDKIAKSGYDSLSGDEKEWLFQNGE